MKIEVRKYEEFEGFKFKDILKTNEKESKILLVSDSNVKIGHNFLNEMDLNGFKVQTCKNQIVRAKLAIFKIKKFSDDFLYTFFKNQYDCAYFFTSEEELSASIFESQEPNIEIIFLNSISKELDTEKLDMIEKVGFQENEEVNRYLRLNCIPEAEKSVEIKRLIHFYKRLIDMIYYDSYKTKFALSLLMNSCLDVYVLTEDKSLFKESNKFLNAKTAILHKSKNSSNGKNIKAFEKERSLCLVLEHDDLFDGSLFEKCYYVLENTDMEDCMLPKLEALKLEEFSIIKNLLLKQNRSNSVKNLKMADFEKYLKKDDAAILNKILASTPIEEKKYEAYRLTEVSIGSAFFPISFSRQLLDSILYDLKSALEEYYLFVRSTIPKISSRPSGFLNKEYATQIEVPGIFDFCETSDFFITKKESINDACYKFMQRLYQKKIVDENLSIIRKNILELKTIQKLFVVAYGTSDLTRIAEIYEEFSKSLDISIHENIVIRNNQVIFSKKKSAPVDHFKKKFIIDVIKEDTDNLELQDIEMSEEINSILNEEVHNSEMPDKTGMATRKIDNNLKSYFYPDCASSKLERSYRKIPDSFSTQNDFMALYTLSNSNTGILCHETLKKDCEVLDRHNQKLVVKNHSSRQYTGEELKLLKFYQVLFFKQIGTVFPSSCQTFKLFYFVVPLRKDSFGDFEIDWNYLKSIYENFFLESVACVPLGSPILKRNVVFNPFSIDFFVYADPLSYNIENKLGDTTFLEFFENKYKISLRARTGKMMFKAFSIEQISASVRKFNNVENSKTVIKTSKTDPELIVKIIESTSLSVSNSSSKDQITGPTFNLSTIACSNLAKPSENSLESLLKNFDSRPADSFLNFDIETGVVCSSEACFVTPIKISIVNEAEAFKRNFYIFETAFITHELITSYNLQASQSIVFQCLTQSGENFAANYERLEFLGDCVLKFYSTNYLYLSFLPIDKIVSTKDTIISNDNLFRICIESGIFKYVQFSLFNSKMVQAPHLSGIESIINFFGAGSVFRSDNLGHVVLGAFDPDVNVKKLYADVIEALFGAVYLESGYLEAIKLMHSLCLFNTISQPFTNQNSNVSQHPNMNDGYLSVIRDSHSPFNGLLYKSFSYLGIIPLKDIVAIQKIILYEFKNFGNLERAFVHPSYSSSLGSNDYDCLELIGDSALDLFVSSKLFSYKELNSPLLLHTAKISYVNNHSLYNIMINSDLISHSRHKLTIGAVKKPISDMFEALLGAILIDLDWSINAFFEVMDRKICLLLKQNCEVDAKYLQ